MVITVGMGEGAVAIDPHVISAAGCGSCVVLALYDAKAKVGGLAHIMLPLSGGRRPASDWDEAYQYADTAVPRLIEEMVGMGAFRKGMRAKLAGGAAMFPSYSAASAGIGQQNVKGVMSALERAGIPLAGRDTGGNHGRNVEFHIASGRVVIKAFGRADREI